ncbi:hypothetical protein AOQ84DRAFT_420402 [Glonium stellatum]|uniref:Uncharacterized protein n=1 Tax=Glonium stellatum TaxID=574774 RepID=A0A8E2F807_9PEZI|nr:hypothetical protein AOQ84DRAFT_420402 [Glonium stellatum]
MANTANTPEIQFNVPTVQDLIHAVNRKRVHCFCEKCDPEFHVKNLNCKTHRKILLKRGLPTKQQSVITPLGLNCYKAEYLIDRKIQYFSRDPAQFEFRQTRALHHWRNLATVTAVQALSETDKDMTDNVLGNQLTVDDMLEIFNIFNDLLFFGAMRNVQFEWRPKLHEREQSYGRAELWDKDLKVQILIDPKAHTNLQSPSSFRLSILLHEALKAFLLRSICRSCKMTSTNLDIGRRGHGRPWQLLATEIEKIVPKLLGFTVNLMRFETIRDDLAIAEVELPSYCDLDRYSFESLEYETGINAITKEIVRRK